jgi:hypothetical protein
MSSLMIGETFDLLLKMVVIGGNYLTHLNLDTAVGKTNLLSRF